MQQETNNQRKNIKVPNIAEELYSNQLKYQSYATSMNLPFYSTTNSLVTERKNSDPNLLRSTMYTLPASEYAYDNCSVPLSLVITPFSDKAAYKELETPDFCKECRSYYNCFTRQEGIMYACNICGAKSDILISNTSTLFSSSYEFLYPTHNLSTTVSVKEPVFVFIVDSKFSHSDKDLYRNMQQILADENFQLLYKNVIFILVHEHISVFSCKGDKKIIQSKILGEAPEVSAEFFTKSADNAAIQRILEHMQKQTELAQVSPRNIKAIFTLLDMVGSISELVSGTKVALISNLNSPTLNYEEYIKKIKNTHISLFCDAEETTLNNLWKLALYSGGKVNIYSRLQKYKFNLELSKLALCRTAFGVKTVLKTSGNIAKSNIVSSSIDDNLSVTRMNSMESSNAITYVLGFNGMDKETKYVQAQITFIDYDGVIKTRILNHSFETGSAQQLYSGMAPDTIFATYVKSFLEDPVPLENSLSKTLNYYRKKCSATVSASQFVIPENLKILPVLAQAFTKNKIYDTKGLSKNNGIFYSLVSWNVEQIVRFFYPRLVCLSEYNGLYSTKPLSLSLQSLKNDEIYVAENGQNIIIYISKAVDAELIDQLFDFTPRYVNEHDIYMHPSIKNEKSEENELLRNLITDIENHYNYRMPVKIIKEGESKDEAEFLAMMVEDALNNQPDYIDYVFKLHYKVQSL
ncbi:protein transport protein SEC24 [Enteropsectra breve]|nr:protein transport protein SEC24 [Enteropsectra breve]